MLENQYQAYLIKTIKKMFGSKCLVLKNDTSYLQGIPDILILVNDRWAMLEVKQSEDAPYQPNQDWYVDFLNGMSFAAFIYPENEQDVLDALQQALQPRRAARISQR